MAEPFDHGLLDVGDGHSIYWEACGNPNGIPVVFLHGGPGAGWSEGHRGLFDPEAHMAILFDQRGCGRSRPLASGPETDLTSNTTQHLLSDIEKLRNLLSIDAWSILGVSWGTTLGLAYAQAHPERVTGMALAFATTTSRREVDWITVGVGRIFPKEWHRFASAVPDHLRGLPLVDAYATLLDDPDPEVHEMAAREWCLWEDAHVSLTPGHQPSPRFEDAEFRLIFSRLVTHYWRNAAFLDDDQLIRDAAMLDGTPGILIHGRHDVSSPLETAWRLSRAWAGAELIVLDDAGHGGDKSVTETIRAAVTRIAL